MRKYTLTNPKEFILRLHDIVNTSVGFDDLKYNPWKKTGDYFGSVKWGEILIYGFGRFLIGRRVILQMCGHIEYDQFIIRFRLKNWGLLLTQTLIGFWFSFIILWSWYELGLVVLILFFGQLLFSLIEYQRCKDKLIRQIEEIIEVR